MMWRSAADWFQEDRSTITPIAENGREEVAAAHTIVLVRARERSSPIRRLSSSRMPPACERRTRSSVSLWNLRHKRNACATKNHDAARVGVRRWKTHAKKALSDRPGLKSFRVKLTQSQMRMPPVSLPTCIGQQRQTLPFRVT